MLLSKENREELRVLDEQRRTLVMNGERYQSMAYMLPYAIIWHFRLEVGKPKTDIEITAMNQLWEEFRRKRWKHHQIELKRAAEREAAAAAREAKEAMSREPMTPEVLTPSQSARLTKEFGVGAGVMSDQKEMPYEEWPTDYLSMDTDERFLWWEYAAENYRKPIDRTKVSALDEQFGMGGQSESWHSRNT